MTEKKPSIAHSPIEVNSPRYFATCGVGGILACGTTHFSMTPIDMIKCRMQVNKNAYTGIFSGLRQVAAKEGVKGLFLGGTPTFIGYSLQGMGKYGFYELFKYTYTNMVGDTTASKYKTSLYLSASATAEFFTDFLLCPMEALKVKMQTSTVPFASSFRSGVSKIYWAEGLPGFYKGLGPLWLRQIPYTMVKFASFENIVAGIYSRVLGRAVAGILKELGVGGVWAGLGPRIFMIGTLTAMQWFIYDTFKVKMGLPTTGGH
ncbi:Cu/Pi carrier [Linderina macrospora]|uniref:Cu/Pi carrier n=1 Tax=Linderina macrospora TaxID=4868 RepID=A0ACC1JEA8_9FUNG|nr:Cu/Pi carrier [Linderina macrospora]